MMLETLQQVYHNFFGASARVPPRHQSDLRDAPETRAAAAENYLG